MGARVVLHDDCVAPVDPYGRRVSNLDQDAPVVRTSVNPVVLVRQRARTSWNADGDPVFEWTDVVEARAIVWETHEELDEKAGVVRIAATCVMPYDGPVLVKETCVVLTQDGLFRCSKVTQFTERLEFELKRIEDSDAEV